MNRRLSVALLTLLTIAISASVVTGCAYRRADRSLVQPLALSKKQFTGEWYYMKTIYEAPYESGFFTGQGGWPLGSKIRWEITERYLYAFNASPNVRNTNSALTPLAAWPIMRHFDIKPAINYSTGEPSNVIIEESRDGANWYQRKYMRVMWNMMVINDYTDIFTTYAQWVGQLRFERANYVPPEKFKITNNYMSYVADEIVTKLFNSYYQMVVYEIPMSSYRIRFRHSFKKVQDSTYTPKEYDDQKFAKFGNFRTSIVRFNPDRGIINWSYKFYANRHNVANKQEMDEYKAKNTPKEKRKPSKIVYYLSPKFPKDLMPAVRKVANSWNEAMAYALQRPQKDADGKNAVFDIMENSTGLPKGQTRELGDLRYNYLWYVNENLSVGLLGYGPSVADPDTGQIVHGSAYLYGGLLRRVVDIYMTLFDILSNRYSDQDITNGAEYYNAVMNLSAQNVLLGIPGNSGMKQLPGQIKYVAPKVSLNSVNKLLGRLNSPQYIQNMKMVRKLDRSMITSRFARIDQNPKAKALLMNDFVMRLAFPNANPTALLENKDKDIQKVLDRYHAHNFAKPHNLQRFSEQFEAPSRMTMYMAGYADAALASFVDWHIKQKTPRDEVRKLILNFLFTSVTAHEVGHSLGLTHNFIGSTDEWNYHNPWHDLKAGKKPANCTTEQGGRCPAYMQQRNFYRSAAIMDYAGEYYDDNQGVGKTERASMAFIYNGLVEKGVDDPRKQGALVKWTPEEEKKHKESMIRNPGKPGKWYLREFRFCSDYMVGQDPYCQRRDAGHNAKAIVDHAVANYDRTYILNYWRRGRRGYGPGMAVNRSFFRFQHISSIYQDWTYRVITQPGYKETEDFKHKLEAVQKGFGFMLRVLSTPRVGLHRKDQLSGLWSTRPSREDKTAASVDIPLGVGRYFFSSINDGYYGIFRFNRTGYLYDKWFSMMGITNRSWGYYNNSVNWIYTNFYDLFRKDTTNLFAQGLSNVWDKNSNLLIKVQRNKKTYTIQPAWHPFLQFNGMLYSLASLNNQFSDRTFSNSMCVGIVGNRKSWTPPGMDKVTCPPPAHLKDRISCFTNFHGTRNYFAVQTANGKSISAKMVQRGNELARELELLRLQGKARNVIERKQSELEAVETALNIMQMYVSLFEGC